MCVCVCVTCTKGAALALNSTPRRLLIGARALSVFLVLAVNTPARHHVAPIAHAHALLVFCHSACVGRRVLPREFAIAAILSHVCTVSEYPVSSILLYHVYILKCYTPVS